MEKRIQYYKQLLDLLLISKPILFADFLPSNLPLSGGVYHIYQIEDFGRDSLYVGKSGNLKERLYNNHLMGNLISFNLKMKLVRDGICLDSNASKLFLRQGYQVQYILIEDIMERTFFEHFAVAIMQPRYND